MLEKLKPYAKSFVALGVGVLQVLSLYISLKSDGVISPEDQVALISAVIIGLGGTGAVYQIPNKKV